MLSPLTLTASRTGVSVSVGIGVGVGVGVGASPRSTPQAARARAKRNVMGARNFFSVGGVIGQDKSSVLSGGVSAFNGALQGFGESKWAVSLDRDLLVVPDNRISSGRTWVILESLLQSLEELAEKADVGGPLGGVADIISKLKLQQSKLEYLNPPMRLVWRPAPD